MNKQLKIDSEDLIMALEDHSDAFEYFIDLENGNVVILSSDFFDEEEFEDEEFDDEELDEEDLIDPDGYNHAIVESNPERFVFIDPIESSESFTIMEEFVATLADDVIKQTLSAALSKRKPFRHFKDELYQFPEVQKEWYAFHEEEMKKIAMEWLEDNDIKAELVRKYLMKDQEADA